MGQGTLRPGGGTTTHGNGLAAPVTNVTPDTSHMFDPYNTYIPQVYNSNQPVTDPTAIIQAYVNHAPEFLKASSGNTSMPPATALKSAHEGK